jgi:hypothetical protein
MENPKNEEDYDFLPVGLGDLLLYLEFLSLSTGVAACLSKGEICEKEGRKQSVGES